MSDACEFIEEATGQWVCSRCGFVFHGKRRPVKNCGLVPGGKVAQRAEPADEATLTEADLIERLDRVLTSRSVPTNSKAEAEDRLERCRACHHFAGHECGKHLSGCPSKNPSILYFLIDPAKWCKEWGEREWSVASG